jgi:multidrug transporter EmrE-like cation transporter
MDESLRFAKRWVITGIVCGFFAGVSYGLSIAVSLPLSIAYPVFWAFGPFLCASAPGLYHFVKHYRNSIPLQIGTLFLIIAGASVTMMATMQAAGRVMFQAVPLEGASAVTKEAWELAYKAANAVQLGADVAWDIFIFASVFLLGMAMFKHPKLGWIFGTLGCIISVLGLAFNIYTFPYNPGTQGLVDVGPFVGLWFTAVSIKIIVSLKWMDSKVEISKK